MTILALEFSSPQRSVAVMRTGDTKVATEVVETGGGGTRAVGMIETALHEAGLEREQIDVIAVGLGPGSYTGIRVALSVAQGWQLACGVKLSGISSVECMAAQAQSEKIFGRVNVVIDAQRNEFYRAAYEISQNAWKEIVPLQIAGPAEIQSHTTPGETWIGPEVTRWFPSGRVIFPRATMLGRLAAGRNDFISGDKLAPIYLRAANFVKAPPVNPVVR
jgi:tRNA threonylcarbamoyladenosine biosynthesis protein TsaB